MSVLPLDEAKPVWINDRPRQEGRGRRTEREGRLQRSLQRTSSTYNMVSEENWDKPLKNTGMAYLGTKDEGYHWPALQKWRGSISTSKGFWNNGPKYTKSQKSTRTGSARQLQPNTAHNKQVIAAIKVCWDIKVFCIMGIKCINNERYFTFLPPCFFLMKTMISIGKMFHEDAY